MALRSQGCRVRPGARRPRSQPHERARLDGTAQRALHQLRRLRGRDQAAPLIAVGGQRRVDRARRDRLAEIGPGGAVPLPCTLGGPGGGVAGDRGEDDGVPADRVPAQVRDMLIKEPLDFPDD